MYRGSRNFAVRQSYFVFQWSDETSCSIGSRLWNSEAIMRPVALARTGVHDIAVLWSQQHTLDLLLPTARSVIVSMIWTRCCSVRWPPPIAPAFRFCLLFYTRSFSVWVTHNCWYLSTQPQPHWYNSQYFFSLLRLNPDLFFSSAYINS